MYLDVTSRSKWVGEPDYIIPAYVDMEDEVEMAKMMTTIPSSSHHQH